MSLSLVLDAFRQQQGHGLQQGRVRPTTDRSPTLPGIARGTMGVTGSRGFQARNSDARLDRDRRDLMQNPVMQAFLRRAKGRLL
jgi:hypothetical protein